MEYTEYITKFTRSHFNWKWNFAQCFLKFDSFRVLGSARTLMATTCQRVGYLLKVALQIGALRLLNTLISVTLFIIIIFIFFKKGDNLKCLTDDTKLHSLVSGDNTRSGSLFFWPKHSSCFIFHTCFFTAE